MNLQKNLRFFLTEPILCGIIHFAAKSCRYALLAQLDRVTDYESVGRGFESPTAHQKKNPAEFRQDFLFIYKHALEGESGFIYDIDKAEN